MLQGTLCAGIANLTGMDATRNHEAGRMRTETHPTRAAPVASAQGREARVWAARYKAAGQRWACRGDLSRLLAAPALRDDIRHRAILAMAWQSQGGTPAIFTAASSKRRLPPA